MAAKQARTKPAAQARASSRKKKRARRTTSPQRKQGSKTKTATRKKTPAKTKKPAKRPASIKRKTASTKTKKTKRTVKAPKSLGRPRLPADAKLDLVFQKDYQAREIFGFLRVTTLRELEEFGPNEIIERLTAPMVETVERIRKALALNNRCLKNDRRFALRFQSDWKQGR